MEYILMPTTLPIIYIYYISTFHHPHSSGRVVQVVVRCLGVRGRIERWEAGGVGGAGGGAVAGSRWPSGLEQEGGAGGGEVPGCEMA